MFPFEHRRDPVKDNGGRTFGDGYLNRTILSLIVNYINFVEQELKEVVWDPYAELLLHDCLTPSEMMAPNAEVTLPHYLARWPQQRETHEFLAIYNPARYKTAKEAISAYRKDIMEANLKADEGFVLQILNQFPEEMQEIREDIERWEAWRWS